MEHFEISKVFKVFKAIVILFKISLNFFTKLSLNLWMTANLVNHHLSKIRSCVSASYVKCCELFEHFFLGNYCLFLIAATFFFGYKQRFQDAGVLAFLIFLQGLIYLQNPLLYKFEAPISISLDSSI